MAWSASTVMAMQEILDAHDQALNLEANSTQQVQVWHLVASLLEFCDARGIDFDEVVEDVRVNNQDWRAVA